MSPLAAVLGALLSVVAIEHVRLEVGDGTVREDVTVLLDGDRVVAVGAALAPPAGATRIDGRGKSLTPGFVDVMTHLGLREVDLESSTVDQGLNDTPHEAATLVPGFRAADGFNPLSVWIPIAREEGVTSAVLEPSHGVLAGTGSWVTMEGTLASTPDPSQPAAMFGSVGTDGAALAGGARGGLWLKLREAVADARWYAANRAAWEQNRSRALSLSPLHLEALQPVLARRLPLLLRANRAADILAALRFAREENLRLVVTGGAEAWLVADALARAQVPVVLVPSAQVPASFEQVRARDDAATLLEAAGVQVVLSCADSSRRRLRQEAGLAVAYGLPRGVALAAITSRAARAVGLEARVGTVAVGKRADVVLWSGDPLELSSFAEQVYIAGRLQPKDTRQRKLVERYLERVPAKDAPRP
jgi:imidazolonepropionase-like amidohydrolase